jgi:small nuclear ribonucleoprotein (snRNP)-like protein
MYYKYIELSKMLTSVFLLLIFLLTTSVSTAAAKVVPVEGINFTINVSMMDNLIALTGKKVSITLDGGKTLTGIIKSVGSQLIHIEKIERKEFFDSLIRIEKIQAIEVRFRKYQR